MFEIYMATSNSKDLVDLTRPNGIYFGMS